MTSFSSGKRPYPWSSISFGEKLFWVGVAEDDAPDCSAAIHDVRRHEGELGVFRGAPYESARATERQNVNRLTQDRHQRSCLEREIDSVARDRLDGVRNGFFAWIDSVGGAELERKLQAIVAQIDSNNLAGANQFSRHDGTEPDRTGAEYGDRFAHAL